MTEPAIHGEFSLVKLYDEAPPYRGPGRPSDYCDETAAEICFRLSEGESLKQICRDPNMPAMSTVRRWANTIPEFRNRYEESRCDMIEHWALELREIADDGTNDWMEREEKSGRIVRVVDFDHVARSRLRVDTLKWLLSKLAPHKYGEKLEVTAVRAGAPKTIAPPVTVEDAERQYAALKDGREPESNT